MLCRRAEWLVQQYQRSSGGSNSVDLDGTRADRVLEDRSHQSMGPEYRSSLACVIPHEPAIRRRLLSGALSARRTSMPVRNPRRVGRHYRCRLGAGCCCPYVDSICEGASAYLEHHRTDRHHFCCAQRTPVWFERLAIDARAAGTSTQSSPNISGAAYYRIAHFDFRTAGASGTSSE